MTRHLPAKNLVGTIHATPSGTFAIAASDLALGNVLRRGVAWADEEVAAIRAVTDANSRVLIVGAHVGTLVVPIARHVRSVEAVEANPDTYRFLAANLAFNDVTNATLHGFAAGERDGDVDFLLSRRNSGGAKRRPVVADPRYTFDDPAVHTIPLRRLDDVLPGTFDAIVMDVEGSEVFALRGMGRLLASARFLFIEFLPHHLRNVAGVDSDALADAVLPHLPRLIVDGVSFDREAARIELRRMFMNDEEHDLIRFSRPD